MALPRAFATAVALSGPLLFLAGCAKTGEPQPPLLRIQKPALDLAARQISGEVVLRLSAPVENTDQSPVTNLALVEIYRVAEDKTAPLTPLEEKEFLSKAQLIFQVPVQQLARYQEGNTLVFRDPLALADRSTIFHRRFRYAARFINAKRQTAGLSNQAHLAPMPLAETPAGLTARVSQDSIRIQWTPPQRNIDGSVPARIAGYNIYRGEDARMPLSTRWNKELLRLPEFEDRNFEFDKTYYFAVTVVGSPQDPYAESLPSPPLMVQTRDTFAPGPPRELNLVTEKPVVILLWVAPPEEDVAGYRIYRREEGSSEKRPLGGDLIKTLSYRDDKAESGKKYEYAVAAVDTHGNEGTAATASIEVP